MIDIDDILPPRVPRKPYFEELWNVIRWRTAGVLKIGDPAFSPDSVSGVFIDPYDGQCYQMAVTQAKAEITVNGVPLAPFDTL